MAGLPSPAQASEPTSGVWKVEWVQVLTYGPRGCLGSNLFGARKLPAAKTTVLDSAPKPFGSNTTSGCAYYGLGPGKYGQDLGGGARTRNGGLYSCDFRLNEDNNRMIKGIEYCGFLRATCRTTAPLRDIMSANPDALERLREFDRQMAIGRNYSLAGLTIFVPSLVSATVAAGYLVSDPYYTDPNRQAWLYTSLGVYLVGTALGIAGQYISESAFSTLLDGIKIYDGKQ
jgi:hypothetical protein